MFSIASTDSVEKKKAETPDQPFKDLIAGVFLV